MGWRKRALGQNTDPLFPIQSSPPPVKDNIPPDRFEELYARIRDRLIQDGLVSVESKVREMAEEIVGEVRDTTFQEITEEVEKWDVQEKERVEENEKERKGRRSKTPRVITYSDDIENLPE